MVTFETQCYENDYEYILKGDRLKKTIDNCNYIFSKRVVIINKVTNRNKVAALAEQYKRDGVIDQYYFAEDYIHKALEHFGISKWSFRGGYYYSRSQLVGLLLCETKYLLHFTTDTYIEHKNESSWIMEAIQLMEGNDKYVCCNPCWNNHYEGAKKESLYELDNWYVGYGFSDNCYLVPTRLFRSKMYNEYNTASDRYPIYAGECFEKRVDSYMRNHGLLRLTNKKISFTTVNFPKKRSIKISSSIKRKLLTLNYIVNRFLRNNHILGAFFNKNI